jgi:hypothetical protein
MPYGAAASCDARAVCGPIQGYIVRWQGKEAARAWSLFPNSAGFQEMEQLVGIDLDPTAQDIAQRRIQEATSGRPGAGLSAEFYRGNYSEVEAALRGLPNGSLYGHVDGMLMDLGVSSMQVRAWCGNVAGRCGEACNGSIFRL